MATTETTKLKPQVFVSESVPEPEALDPIKNDYFWKPRSGGLWTSTLNDEGGGWLRWLHGEGYSLDQERWGGKLWQLEPAEANLYVAWSPKEFRELVRRYPHPEMEDFNTRIRAVSVSGFGEDFYLWVDWEEMSKDYDGLHVPTPYSWRFHDDHAASMFFYSMDAECTCWFRWCFEGRPVELDPEPFLTKLGEKYD